MRLFRTIFYTLVSRRYAADPYTLKPQSNPDLPYKALDREGCVVVDLEFSDTMSSATLPGADMDLRSPVLSG